MILRALRPLIPLLAVMIGAPVGSALASPDHPVIGLVLKSLNNEFFRSMEASATYYQNLNKDKFDLRVAGVQSETDIQGQIDIVNRMIEDKVDAIVLAPADSKELIPVVKRAIYGGIDVVNIDNRFDTEALSHAGVKIAFVGPDNRSAARRVALKLARKLAKGDHVGIISGNPGSFNGQQRSRGFREGAEAAGLIVVDDQPGMWESEPARRIAAAYLDAHADLKAILCGNDSMALGAVEAIKAAGKRGLVLVAGFDNVPAIRPLLASHEVEVTAEQYGDQMAVFGIKRALADLTGVEETPVEIVTGG